jgi:hypothetical protein
MLSTTSSPMIGRPDIALRGSGVLTPEVQSLLDTVIKSVLDWATQQTNSNRDSNSLGGIPSSLPNCQPQRGYGGTE